MERSSKTTTSIASVRLCGFRNWVMEWGAEGLGGSKYRYILLLDGNKILRRIKLHFHFYETIFTVIVPSCGFSRSTENLNQKGANHMYNSKNSIVELDNITVKALKKCCNPCD